MSYPIDNFFPIYDLLQSQVNNNDKELSETEIKDLITKINALDKTGRDMIYVFIRIHSLRHSTSKLLDIPYGGSKLNKVEYNSDMICDVKFDIRCFPPVLSRMLSRFSDLHLRKLKEDQLKTEL